LVYKPEEAGSCMGERRLEPFQWVARLHWASGNALGLPQLWKLGILQCDISTHIMQYLYPHAFYQ
jgi:hypothetical protein